MSALDRFELAAVRMPMRVRFRGVTHRDVLLLRGSEGWGEFSPFPEYGPEYCARWLGSAVTSADAPWPAPVRDRIPVNTTIPAVSPADAHARAASSGCLTAKVKVGEPGQSLAHDRERVAAVRDALGPDGRIRVDANGAWDVATAVMAIARLDRYDLEYVEQPVATLEELREVRRRVRVPVAADEVVRTAEDPVRVASVDAADVLVLKVQPLGGVVRALEVAAATSLPVVVSSALETSVGLAAGVAFAAALPELPYACGLGTVTLLSGDVTEPSLVPEDGAVTVARPAPTRDLLERWAAPPEVARELRDRAVAADRAAGRYV